MRTIISSFSRRSLSRQVAVLALALGAGLIPACAPHFAFAQDNATSPDNKLVSPSMAAILAPGGEVAAKPPAGAASGVAVGTPVISAPATTATSTTTTTTTRSDSNGIAVSGSAPPTAPAGYGTPSYDPAMLQRQAEEVAARAQMEETKRTQEHVAKSFDKASGGLLPLSPEQIRDFMKRYEATQEASQPPVAGPPKAEVKVNTLSLDPGAVPPEVNLAAGYVTTINISDSTGEPWPILDVGVGGNFEVTPTAAGSHVVRIVPLTRLASGNLSVILKDLSTPVIFRLSAGGPSVHMRYDARIPKRGPNAKMPLIAPGRNAPTAGDEAIMAVLENNPPKAAKRMKIAGLDARTMAWQVDSKVFLRTPLQLLSPAWNASVSSTDGVTVYEIGEAPVLLMSDNGAMVRARLSRDEDHDK